MSPRPEKPSTAPYPERWDEVAEVRVFRATPEEWDRISGWRGEMQRKGWKLLRVSTEEAELVAIFGRTRPELRGKGDDA